MLNKERINNILSKYSDIKLHTLKNPILLSGYRTFHRPFTYKYRSDIIGIINARAYRVRMSNIMNNVIDKFKNKTTHQL